MLFFIILPNYSHLILSPQAPPTVVPISLAREPLPCPPDALQILFRDASVLVVAKPNGLPVMHSELYYQHTVMETLKRMAEKEVRGVGMDAYVRM